VIGTTVWELITRGWEQLLGRDDGPMAFRLVVQPLVSTILAIRSGLRDAREGQPPFLWAAVFHREQRGALLRHGWKDVGRVFIVTVILDVIYQLYCFRWVYPLQVVIVAIVLAFVPYLVMRGVTNRIARRILKPK
jgi:hypothetical protein